MHKNGVTAGLVLAGLLVALASVPAKADNVDFTCSLSGSDLCTGTIVQTGSNYSTTGINVFNDSGPYGTVAPFTLAFDTSTNSISMDGTGVDLGQNLIGNILSFTVSGGGATTDLSFTNFWPILPVLVQDQLGSTQGADSGFLIYISTSGSAQSVDVLITPGPSGKMPAPEPASLMLLGSGLLGLGGLLHRKLRRA